MFLSLCDLHVGPQELSLIITGILSFPQTSLKFEFMGSLLYCYICFHLICDHWC